MNLSNRRKKVADFFEFETKCLDLLLATVDMNGMSLDKLKELSNTIDFPKLFMSLITKLSKEEIFQNPYLQNIKVPSAEKGNMCIGNKRIILRETISAYKMKERYGSEFILTPSFFVSDDNLRFPCLIEKGTATCYMTAEPFEFESFKQFINEASGNILTVGCGVGYLSYMLSIKEDVESVSIIECNKDVIDLFKEHILPQFSHPEKINIICDDVLTYLNNNDLNQYDFINIDTWYDVYDMCATYLKCLKIEQKYPNVKISYWLEPELRSAIQKGMLKSFTETRLLDIITDKVGSDMFMDAKVISDEQFQRTLQLNDFRNSMLDWYNKHSDEVDELHEKTMKQFVKIPRD